MSDTFTTALANLAAVRPVIRSEATEVPADASMVLVQVLRELAAAEGK